MSDQIVMPKIDYPNPMTLRLAALYLDLSEMRIRTLVREGRISAEKVDGKWLVSQEALDEYTKTKGQRTGGGGGTRGDGKLWVIRVKYANVDAVKKALEPFGIELQPRYNYQQQAEYRQKQKAKKAAEKKASAAAAAAAKKQTTAPAK